MSDITEAVVKATTDDWAECMSKPKNQTGIMARMSLRFLPDCVDASDPRVIEIQRQIRAALEADGGAG